MYEFYVLVELNKFSADLASYWTDKNIKCLKIKSIYVIISNLQKISVVLD